MYLTGDSVQLSVAEGVLFFELIYLPTEETLLGTGSSAEEYVSGYSAEYQSEVDVSEVTVRVGSSME